MKAWYDDIDTAILQRIKTYSAFNDFESKNLMIQTMYEYREKEIAELEKENTELKERIKWYSEQICNKECAEVWEELTKAKEIIDKLSKSLFLAKGIIRDLIDDTVDFKESKERAIYCYEQEHFDTYKEAVQFLKEVEK